MPKTMVLRVKSRAGRFPLSTLYPDSTLSELQKALKEKTELPPNTQKILLGFPPREIDSYDPLSTLVSLCINSGDTLILEELPPDKARPTEVVGGVAAEERLVADLRSSCEESSASGRVPEISSAGSEGDSMGGLVTCLLPAPYVQGGLRRRVVPADNSCLFRSVSVLLCDCGDSSDELRELAAAIIMSDPEKYNSAFLGRSNQDYVQWLRKKESWGGAIELKIFSEHYKVELDVVDIQTKRIDRFGEDCGYSICAFLLYDGIHYDPLVWESGGTAPQQGIFPVEDEAVVMDALEIARKAHKARQFTDISHFSLRCLVCGKALRGQADAMGHAKNTGHSNFGEV